MKKCRIEGCKELLADECASGLCERHRAFIRRKSLLPAHEIRDYDRTLAMRVGCMREIHDDPEAYVHNLQSLRKRRKAAAESRGNAREHNTRGIRARTKTPLRAKTAGRPKHAARVAA